MEVQSAYKMADIVTEAILAQLGKDKIKDVIVHDVDDTPSQFGWQVDFLAYDFCWVRIVYSVGNFDAYVLESPYPVNLHVGTGRFEGMDLHFWIHKLDDTIRLRIPDKYLATRGYK